MINKCAQARERLNAMLQRLGFIALGFMIKGL